MQSPARLFRLCGNRLHVGILKVRVKYCLLHKIRVGTWCQENVCLYTRTCWSDKFTVEQYCGEVTVQFSDVDFFNKVKKSLIDHYPALRHQQTSQTGHEPQYITDQCGHDVSVAWPCSSHVGHDVSLSISDDARALVVGDDGALPWTMRDFQFMCRNITTATGTYFCIQWFVETVTVHLRW